MISFKEYLVEAPLTPQQRLQRKRLMKRLAPKMAMKRKLAAKKKASPEKLMKRAEKKARDIVRAKFLGKDKKYNDLSMAAKIQLDKKVETKKALIKKIAKKLMPKVKAAEVQRLQKTKQSQDEATVSIKKENNEL